MTSGHSRGSAKHVLSLIRRGAEHSSLYYWMVEHHDEMVAAGHETRIRWGALCAALIDLGLKDGRGSDPRPSTARQTWLRVRQALQRQRQQPASPPVQPEQVEIMPPMRSSVPVGYGSSVSAHASGSPVPSWMPPDIDAPPASDIVPSDRPRTGLNRLGETPEEAAIRTARRISIARHTVADAGGRIPPRKV